MRIMNPDLQTILLQDNPWLLDRLALDGWLQLRLPEVCIPRPRLDTARLRWHETNRAHLVVGPRQAGKSTAIWMHLAEMGEPVLFLDCEQALVRDACRSAPLFLDNLGRLVGGAVSLFFEEAQWLEEAGLFLKGLIDRRIGVPLLVTGSSSFHLGARTRESLAGRATRTRLLPLAFGEVVGDRGDQPELIRQRRCAEHFARHLIYGGYPEVWRSETPERLLADLVEAMILRDASDLFRIKRPEAFRRLLRLAAGQSGNLINYSEWAQILGISRDTVASYLEILDSSHVVVALPPFAGGRRSELTRSSKIYLVDSGIRNQLIHEFRPLGQRTDAGALLENWIFSELWKVLPEGATLHFWRSTSGAEVDFVLARGETVVGVEVKAQALKRPKLPRAAWSFVEAYRPRAFFLVNMGLAHQEHSAATDLRWLAPWDLADAVGEAFA